MPPRIPKSCRKQGCNKVTTDKSGYCDTHKPTDDGWARYRKGKSNEERGYGTAWRKLRAVVLERDRYLCQCSECKANHRIRTANEVDHIIAKVNGGSDELDNLQAINSECHKRKTRYDRKR